MIQRNNIWKQGDPSPFYDIYSQDKLGIGGFAKVYRVKRKADQKDFALKFCTPSEEDRQLMLNEVALMRICSSGANGFCIHVEDACDEGMPLAPFRKICIHVLDCGKDSGPPSQVEDWLDAGVIQLRGSLA